MPSPLKSAFASSLALVVVGGLAVGAATPAQAAAPDAATTAVTGLFERLATDFLPQVASSTALAEQLPTLAVTPAGSVELKTAFAEALGSGGPLAEAGTQETLAALTSYIDGATGDDWTFTAANPNAFTISVGFTRTVSQQAGLDIRDQDGTLSLSTGTGIQVEGTLSGSFTFAYDPTTDLASLRSPSMTIATRAGLRDGEQLDAGLGILGVKVVGTAGDEDYNLSSNVATSWANPDNDAAGSLAYDNPTTPAVDDGELAADGAGSGLVTATRTGSLAGALVAQPRATDVVAGLPQVSATVTLTSQSPATFEAPSVTAEVPEAAEPFLTLTPRDLAAGLSQAASAIIGMQDAGDGDLPLMRGSIGNAIDAVGGIKAFLAEQVPDADPDDQTPGQPSFASLQDMLVALDTATYASGWSIDVLTDGADAAVFVPGPDIVNFTVRTTRSVDGTVELNPLGAATTGAGTFTATGLDATGVDFNGPQNTGGADLVGRKVSAGTSYGTVATIVDGNSLTLTAEGWSAGTPANGTTFAIEAADPKTGAPQLADALATTTGIATANADLSTATITPDVQVTLPMALDLSAPLTYLDGTVEVPDCDPGTGTAPCPFQQVDASGLGRIITSLPLASDRILLRGSKDARDVLVADADVTSPVQIATSSGFLGLSIGGNVVLATPADQHLQVLTLEPGADLPIPAFVEKVRLQAVADPGAETVFTQKLNGSVQANLAVSVDDAPDAFAPGQGSTALTVSGTVDGLADGIDAGDLTVTPANPARAALLQALDFEPDNPLSLFSGVQGALEGAGTDLTSLTGGGLDLPIPLVGSSVGQLLGAGASGAVGAAYTQNAGVPAVDATETTPEVPAVPATTTLTDPGAEFGATFIGRRIVVGSTVATIVDATETTLVLSPQFPKDPPVADTPYLVENELLGAVHVLQTMTPATLQETVAMAQASLGNDSTIDFGLVDDGGDAQLRLDLTWERAYGVSRSLSLELEEGQELIAASGGGELSIEASGTVNLRLLLPLSAAAMEDPLDNTLVDESASGVTFDVALAAEDAYMGASIGPVGIDLGKASDPGSVHAGFGVEATGGTGEDTPSIADYFTSDFDVAVTNGGADCDEAAQVLCAEFPIYVNGTKPSPTNENLTVTTSLGAGDSLATVFGEANTDITLPTGLQKILDGTAFKFDTLAEGLKQYLFYSEVALRTAASDGELPVIGKDLQAGADFMGATRVEIDDFIANNEDPTTVSGARGLLQTQLAQALDIPVNGPTGVQVDFTCTATLEPPAAPGVVTTPTPAAAGDTTQWVYKVVSTYTDAKGVKHDSIPSEATVVTNAATLTATPVATAKFNTVSWTKVPGATGYKVLRALQTGTVTPTAYRVVADLVGGSVLTFADKGAVAATTDYVAETKAYARVPGATCANDTSVLQIEGVTVALKMGTGKISPLNGCLDDVGGRGECITAKLGVDLGLPGLSLKTGESGSVSGSVGWALDVKLGLSRSRGFYIDTSDKYEFEVGAALRLDQATGTGPDLTAQLAIIDVDVDKLGSAPEFVGHFGIDMLDDKADLDSDLTLAEMGRLKVKDVIEVSVNAKVDINWHLQASADAALPGIGTDFRLTWSWGASSAATSPPPPTNPVKPTNNSTLVIQFNRVTLNTGEFFGQALKPYVQQLVDATKPLQPVIDTIFTPMPVISDLSKAAGGKAVTIASLAETFNTLPGGAQIKPFLDAIKIIKALTAVNCTGATCGVVIGSFTLAGPRVATTNATAGNASSLIATKDADKTAASNAIAAKDKSNNLATPGGTSKLADLKKVISIPVLEDPTKLFDLISGGDIALVEFDSGALSLGFQFQKSFGPIYTPPPVMMVIGGGASVTLRIAAGFDTYGIRRAIETGEGAQVLDSLYFKTVDASGRPIPVVQFTGYLEAGASVSIGILEVGVLGGIKLTVGFYWNDPNSDGKFRLFEFSGAVANNPICLFNVGGELSLYIKIFVVIGFSPFAVDFDFTLVNIKLLDFNLKPDCTPPPPRLGGRSGTVLYVFAGAHGGAGPRGDSAWAANKKDETWVVRQVPGYRDGTTEVPAAVEIRGLGLTESFPDPGGNAIETVVVDGRGYEGNLTISFTGGSAPVEPLEPPGPFDKTAVVFTGIGDDVIRTGEGDSWVDSGAGSDLVTTLDRTDLAEPVDPLEWATANVAGGTGADSITVGNGDDTVTGDGSLYAASVASLSVSLAPAADGTSGTTTLTDPLNAATVALPSDAALFAVDPLDSGADQIAAGLGRVRLSGNGGTDTIGTANDSPLADSAGIKAGTTGGSAGTEALYRARSSVLVGGAGSDVMKSGSADDTVYTGSYDTIGESGTGAGDAATDVNIVDTGVGSDTVYGSNGLDFVTTGSSATQKAVVYGGAGADVLTGGLGTDEIYGGPDDDYVVASPATVGEPGSASDVLGSARDVGVLPGAGSSEKLLVGGTGSDRIYGADGPSRIFGDTTVDACATQSDPVSKQPGETANALDASDLILGGNGVDVVNAGGAGDWVYASGAADRVCGNAGVDRLHGGDDDDLVHGGSGSDQGFGEAGADQVYGNDGDDALYGADGADRLQGNKGADWLDGGTEDDVLLGGTSQAGTTDGADVLLGAGGADVLVGDNAQTDVLISAPYPTDLGSTDATLGGDDHLVGGDDADAVRGGVGDDVAYGGTGDDHVEGDPGTDRIWGEAGDDDIVGGSSELASGLFAGSEPGRPDATDHLYGGSGQDVIAGDNARVTRTGTPHPLMAGRGLASTRSVDLADESAAAAPGLAGDDEIRGDADTDVIFGQRGADTLSLGDAADYGEGGPGSDLVHGDAGDDDVVGGSFTPATGATNPAGQPDAGDTLAGDAGEDVVLGDNGSVTRPAPTGASTTLLAAPVGSPLTANRLVVQRAITPYDLGETSSTAASGPDTITGDSDNDVLIGQGGDDRTDGGTGADYAEGGQGSDLVLGGSDDDDVAGGSFATITSGAAGATGQPDGADNVYGGAGSDLAIGDNGLLTRVTSGIDWRTLRANATQSARVPGRAVVLYDLNGVAPATATTTHASSDSLSGQEGVDVLLGQDGNDRISGGGDDDYVEGEGGADVIHGDLALSTSEIVAAPPGSAWSTPDADGAAVTAGQDDIAGGSSRQGYRDGDDLIHGDGDDDFVVGDNGSVARVVDGGTTDRVYAERYGSARVGHAKVRVAGGGAASTRFCPAVSPSATSTCETSGSWGKDTLLGDAGQDVLYGQDGDDTIRGGTDDDDIYGELGADVLFGEDGEDAILGDRGGVRNRYEDGSRSVSSSLTQPPAITYRSRLAGSVSRETDLLHDVNGTDLVGTATSAPMALDGITYGGVDRIRGGTGRDSIHAGAGDDLANGDSGGDAVFGGRGKDALWGGLGAACAPTNTACLINPGVNGEFIDHLFGGKDEDVIDWRPRGVYGAFNGTGWTGRTCSILEVPTTTKKDGTTDPCSWFEITDRADDSASTPSSTDNNQHHQGVDWMYGGWDRDVMQGDLSQNGPNEGDRLIDWSGVYNLYSHCNAAYGGFNDVRIPNPAMERFVREWATGVGAGRPAAGGSAPDVATAGTSAYDELALVNNADGKGHGTGSAYPSTPGHFDDAGACSGF
ncbi:Ca2+-binding protein, RTX toxin-related [Nocardioides alpinus]|uniref:Ca2+-binding protein, RTX toxin-related n=1 Tax=Nocardioides alpinus TaxID=748909 RepID=A0A1I1AWQ2_9ACTN|nr:calcium-binding protein [Nocardioides alpinus]PKH40912.1 hypothetical protein CXG46_10625 [Nocardioides alpinus]SFB41962.1 Ca2+-binding protein, RTX toxin-related [Nocardioides alpinus]